jgi:CYTH domain-containing protein
MVAGRCRLSRYPHVHNDSVPSRAPGEGRYSRLEREQRWLLDSLPRHRHDPVEILDRYLTDTRLRLRRVQSDKEVLWKLGQKVRERSGLPEVVKLTNIYLSEQEYLALTKLDARVLHKTRWHWEFSGRSLAADDFHGPLSGLVVAEVELGPDDERLAMPPGGIADVTDDDRFSGGALASLSAEEAAALLRVVDRTIHPGPRG